MVTMITRKWHSSGHSPEHCSTPSPSSPPSVCTATGPPTHKRHGWAWVNSSGAVLRGEGHTPVTDLPPILPPNENFGKCNWTPGIKISYYMLVLCQKRPGDSGIFIHMTKKIIPLKNVKVKEAYSSLCYKHRTATGACMRCWIIQSYLPPDRGSTPALTTAVIGQYSIYPPIKDERLSRPEPTQANDLPRVATEVPAIPGVSWLSRPSVPLGMVGVNN